MELLTTIKNNNRVAKVFAGIDGCFTVEYYQNAKLITKTHHVEQYLAEELAEDFIQEGGSDKQFLSEIA